MGIELAAGSGQILATFGCYLLGVAFLSFFAHRYLSRGDFLKEYFLGNRGLGSWVLALTVAATAISGGTFMGFPSFIYTNGWIMALWICSYMVVPLTSMVLLGKRINQVARISGAVTVPDVLRDRFDSPALGVTASLLLLLFLPFNLVAQFKAGGLVMQEALGLLPPEATFLGADEDATNKLLLLNFQLPDGQHAVQKTPYPGEKAQFLADQTRVKTAEREVIVVFQFDGQRTEKKVKFPAARVQLPLVSEPLEIGYIIGVLIFALTVVAYTTYGGFWAVTWTDVLEGIVMLVGVVLMAFLAVRAVAPITVDVQVGDAVVQQELHGLTAATETLRRQDPHLVYGPGPKEYLPIGLGFSFFLMWSLMSPGQPSGMVRLMSFKDSASLRRALVLVGGYYLLTYVSLMIIFTCARAIFPTEYLREIGSEGEPDRIMPAMARKVTETIPGGPFITGLLLAAPYAAIMSTVAAFLLLISSSLVRDLYQRVINPDVSPRTIKRVSYTATALVGGVVLFGAMNPPGFLQYIIVFTGTGQGCSFLVPMALGLYWRRATRAGMLAAMLGGFLTVFSLYALGWIDSRLQGRAGEQTTAAAGSNTGDQPHREAEGGMGESLKRFTGWGQKRLDSFAPLYIGGLDPLVWGLFMALLLGFGVSWLTRVDPELVHKYFPSS